MDKTAHVVFGTLSSSSSSRGLQPRFVQSVHTGRLRLLSVCWILILDKAILQCTIEKCQRNDHLPNLTFSAVFLDLGALKYSSKNDSDHAECPRVITILMMTNEIHLCQLFCEDKLFIFSNFSFPGRFVSNAYWERNVLETKSPHTLLVT